ncbi:MAG: methionyl-tRNA formyltransferase [Bacteroidetes bacterium]|nr:methionyl-tRNA formyltransferase [Bacteroidota bacterium]
MGTPEFAVPMLETLCSSAHEVVGVVTAPDKPAGRGMQLSESEVKVCALKHHLKILQPEKLKNPEFLAELSQLQADIFIVVAFRMLPEVVWNMPPLGTINLHASLLPQYRGAAPINRAIMNGEKETGVTTFFLQHEIDTGKIIFSEKIKIRQDETAGELYQELMKLGASVLLKTVDAIATGQYPQIAQDHITNINHAPKIFKDDCRINWSNSTQHIYNQIRGLSPYPAAFTTLDNKNFKILKAKPIPGANSKQTYNTDGYSYLRFNCLDGQIDVLECQMEGKKKMTIGDFLRGYKLIPL